MTAKFPEIRVTRQGACISRVEWDPKVDGAPVFDLTGMYVMRVQTDIDPGDLPSVTVTFRARLVEAEES